METEYQKPTTFVMLQYDALEDMAIFLQLQTSLSSNIRSHMIPLGEDENKHKKIYVINERGGTVVIFFFVLASSRATKSKDEF